MNKAPELSCSCANGGARPCGKITFEYDPPKNGFPGLYYVYWYRLSGSFGEIPIWERIKIIWKSLIHSDYNYMLADIIVNDKQQIIDLRNYLNEILEDNNV